MSKRIILLGSALLAVVWTATSGPVDAVAASKDGERPRAVADALRDKLLRTYCITCHRRSPQDGRACARHR